ncbi:MAG: U32 family peptidase [Nitrospiraceae bacterium]|nr:MAG: U32 family peptidase [Nitrospiraceae bacterium]
MKISVATNWDDELIPIIDSINNQNPLYPVKEIFGSIQASPLGSGRSSAVLPSVSDDRATAHIKKAQDHGIQFNYLLNASCLGNREYDQSFRKKIFQYLDWISSLNVDIVTVTIPYLIDIIRANYPHLKINVSIVNHIGSIKKLKAFANMNVSRITLDFFKNRVFNFLKKAVELSDLELEILANDPCLLDCPNRYYHYNIVSHGSQATGEDRSGSFFFDYPFLNCTIRKLLDTSEIIKSPWIRPEDLKYYDETGIEWLKLSGRFMHTAWLKRCMEAYARGTYEGNLYDIVDHETFRGLSRKFNTSAVNFDLMGDDIAKIEEFSIFVDNKKLNGFMEYFLLNGDKCNLNCYRCSYCESVAKKVVSIDSNQREDVRGILERASKILVSSEGYNAYEVSLKESWRKSVSG